MRGVIFGFNRQGQRLNGSQVQRSHILNVILLVLKALEVQAIRTINPVHGREGEQRCLPSSMLVNEVCQSRQCRAKQIVGEAPEVAFLPSLRDWFVLSKRNHSRDWNRIG